MIQPQIPWWRTDLGQAEGDRLLQAIEGRCINQGRLCRELEERFETTLAVKHGVTCASGSAALVLALLACGVKPGDEVIVPAVTFIATAHAVKLIGAKVRLVDVLPDRPLIDPAAVASVIAPRTRAIIAVHLNGCACEMAALRSFGIPVIEDSAQAFCSRGPEGWLGTLGAAGTFSLSIAKLMTTGEGGFLVTNSYETAIAARRLRNQGVDAISDNVFAGFGFNFRLTDLQAAVGLAQFARLEQKIAAVRKIYQFYRGSVPGLNLLPVDLDAGEVPLWTQARFRKRETMIARLAENGIQARPFTPCLADSPHLEASGDFPNARCFASEVLTLPSGPDQTQADLERVASTLRAVLI